jgi:hypothetical protein
MKLWSAELPGIHDCHIDLIGDPDSQSCDIIRNQSRPILAIGLSILSGGSFPSVDRVKRGSSSGRQRHTLLEMSERLFAYASLTHESYHIVTNTMLPSKQPTAVTPVH